MRFILSYVRGVAVFIWLLFSCSLGLLACFFSWAGLDANVFAARIFSWGACKICGIHVRYFGTENLVQPTPCIYVGNHQSGMDMATYGAIIPRNMKVIGKTELKWIPIFGFFLWAAGNVLIHRADRKRSISGLDEAVEEIKKRGVSIWIFPEGTRNDTGEGLLPFKKGAFHMAIAAQIPIVPLVSSTLKNIAILETPDIQGGNVTVKVLPPIHTAGMTKDDVDKLSALVREKMLAALPQ